MFQNFKDKADDLKEQVQEQATDLSSAAQGKLDDLLDDYKRILPMVEELGLRVSSFHIEAGVLPQIQTSLVGSVDNLNNEAVEKIIAENESNKLLTTVLRAILMAKKCHERLEDAYISILKDIAIDIQLGIPPKVSVRFQ
ncbi:hypothetical protein [Spirulina sp. 06S082]|uniref:hypothetical protein n=1 Tax=Spirulina sp. 06S082 TaxID=3110248 RepID=UPI002B1FD69C|nr:hypothetical protein [Spirulina sp. 06S082]MEA5468409.1 hypothetical protein [Spirulina sp. 06S082]